MNNNSWLGKIFAWGQSAQFSDTTLNVWLLGLVLILVFSFLWSTVVAQVLRESRRVVSEVAA